MFLQIEDVLVYGKIPSEACKKTCRENLGARIGCNIIKSRRKRVEAKIARLEKIDIHLKRELPLC